MCPHMDCQPAPGSASHRQIDIESALSCNQPPRDPLSRRLLSLLAAWSLFAVYGALFCYLAVRHIGYPGFTEPMEGDVLQHVRRVTHGLSPYAPLAGDFIPLSFMPLYYLAAAPFYLLFGDSFAGPRLLSSLCALLSAGLVTWMARRQSGSSTTAALAGTFFFASYGLMDGCLTCGLGDSLMLACILGGIAFLAYGRKAWHDVAWVMLFSLAFWTKQQGALYGAVAVAVGLWVRGRSLPRWGILIAWFVSVPLAYVLAAWLWGGDFLYFTLSMPGHWDRQVWFTLRRTSFFVVALVPFQILLSLPYLIDVRRRGGRRRDDAVAWFTIGTLVVSATTMMVAGSSNNHYVPAVAMLCVTSALGGRALCRVHVPGWWVVATATMAAVSAGVVVVAEQSGYGHRAPMHAPWLLLILFGAASACRATASPKARRPLIALAVAGHLAIAWYDPRPFLPSPGARAAFEHLGATIAGLDGPVLWTTYGSAPSSLCGVPLAKGPSWVALEDLTRQTSRPDESRRRHDEWIRLFRSARPAFLLSNDSIPKGSLWDQAAGPLELVHDFGDEFRGVRQITVHWFVGGSEHPRFLYRVVPGSD